MTTTVFGADDEALGPAVVEIEPRRVVHLKLEVEIEKVLTLAGRMCVLLPQDMNVIITELKKMLGAYGWGEVLRRDRPRDFTIPNEEVRTAT